LKIQDAYEKLISYKENNLHQYISRQPYIYIYFKLLLESRNTVLRQQYVLADQKASSILECIRRGVASKEK